MIPETTKTTDLHARMLACALLVLGAASVFAGASASGPSKGSGGGEAIGSLPCTVDGSGQDDWSAESRVPVLAIRGLPNDLRAAITSAQGDGRVEQRGFIDGTVEFVFYGHVSVWLDKATLAASSIAIRFDINPSFGAHVADVKVGGIQSSRMLRTATDLPLDLDQLLSIPKVSTGAPVTITLINAAHTHQVFGVRDVGASIRIDQRN
ncbi:MAG: hypothetical protein K8S98_02885 [Planctomycetes bacterium]|nr:hypothetical protein [Planctomycetota bacterium]